MIPHTLPQGASERMRLARLALAAALRVPGVIRTDGGPGDRFVSAGDGERVQGVICTAAGDGGYEISLRLVCALVPLQRVAEQARTAVLAAASMAGIRVVSVDVQVADVAGPEAA
jgi:uncharacterized alkaline shock family protein YloU